MSTRVIYERFLWFHRQTKQGFFPNATSLAAHGHTSAEIVHDRADAAKPNMGMTTFAGSAPRKGDAEIAKNYLTGKELDIQGRLNEPSPVERQYLEAIKEVKKLEKAMKNKRKKDD